MKKKVGHAFGKDIYLIGRRKDGSYVWLEKASWDCGHYWGFGYIETYTNNRSPENSRDIASHEHWDSSMVGMVDGKYIHHINENPDMDTTVLSNKESWELSDLMKTFYTLKNASEVYNRGNSNVSSTKVDLKNESLYKEINEVQLPLLFNRIYELLTPVKKAVKV